MRADETGIAFSWRHTSSEYVCASANSYAVDTKTRKLTDYHTPTNALLYIVLV